MSGTFACSADNPDCSITYLPAETLSQIFTYLNTHGLVACTQTCRYWRHIINNTDSIWRSLCATLTVSYISIEADRHHGYSWKDTFQRHYGADGIKILWKQGTFSNLHSHLELQDKPFCRLDTDTWGQILQWELDRT